MQREQWHHPRTGEQAETQLHPGVARLIRGGQVSEHRHPDDWEEQARQRVQQMHDAARLQAELLAAHPEQLESHDFGGPGHADGAPDPFSFSLRINPAQVHIAPPPDSLLLHSLAQQLQAEGFIRRTTFEHGRLWLPDELEAYRSALEGSLRPVIRLAADPGRRPAPWESKVGGVPYRPLGAPWPVAVQPDGRPLVFLAQLNMAELNAGGGLPDFPDRGIVQVFVMNDMWYGAEEEPWMSLNGAQSKYRVLYWPDVIEDVGQLDAQVPPPQVDPQEVEAWAARGWDRAGIDNELIDAALPHDPNREIALAHLTDREPVSGADDAASRLLGTDIWDAAPESDGVGRLASPLYDLAAGGHKLGGYPNFTQSDPRGPEDSDLILLFQLDSDDALGLMWGDGGTANFFIRPADLAARDFSRVAMHWDCG